MSVNGLRRIYYQTVSVSSDLNSNLPEFQEFKMKTVAREYLQNICDKNINFYGEEKQSMRKASSVNHTCFLSILPGREKGK